MVTGTWRPAWQAAGRSCSTEWGLLPVFLGQQAVWVTVACKGACQVPMSPLFSLSLGTWSHSGHQEGKVQWARQAWEGAVKQQGLVTSDHCTAGKEGLGQAAGGFHVVLYLPPWLCDGRGCTLIPTQRLPGSQGRCYHQTWKPYLPASLQRHFAFRWKLSQTKSHMRSM